MIEQTIWMEKELHENNDRELSGYRYDSMVSIPLLQITYTRRKYMRLLTLASCKYYSKIYTIVNNPYRLHSYTFCFIISVNCLCYATSLWLIITLNVDLLKIVWTVAANAHQLLHQQCDDRSSMLRWGNHFASSRFLNRMAQFVFEHLQQPRCMIVVG